MAIVGYRSHRIMSEANGPDRWACYCLECAPSVPSATHPIDDEDPAEDERIICDNCGNVIYEGWPEE